MEYTDQTALAIRLYLVEGKFNIDQFTILEHSSFNWKDLDVVFGILGESHFLSFTHKDKTFHEICACTEASLDTAHHVRTSSFLHELESVPLLTQFDGIQYRFSYVHTNWSEGRERLQDLHTRIAGISDESTYSLTHLFPSDDPLREDPVTEIHVSAHKKINVATVHTYPNEDIMVFTESELIIV